MLFLKNNHPMALVKHRKEKRRFFCECEAHFWEIRVIAQVSFECRQPLGLSGIHSMRGKKRRVFGMSSIALCTDDIKNKPESQNAGDNIPDDAQRGESEQEGPDPGGNDHGGSDDQRGDDNAESHAA